MGSCHHESASFNAILMQSQPFTPALDHEQHDQHRICAELPHSADPAGRASHSQQDKRNLRVSDTHVSAAVITDSRKGCGFKAQGGLQRIVRHSHGWDNTDVMARL